MEQSDETVDVLPAMVVSFPAWALQPGPDDVYVRIVGVGEDLCAANEIPGEHYMIYGAGHCTGNSNFRDGLSRLTQKSKRLTETTRIGLER